MTTDLVETVAKAVANAYSVGHTSPTSIARAAIAACREEIERDAYTKAAARAKFYWIEADYETVGIADADLCAELCRQIHGAIKSMIEDHTPVPWRLDKDGDIVERREGWLIACPRVPDPPNERDQRDPLTVSGYRANRELIAAAPELYDFWLANQWQESENPPPLGVRVLGFDASGCHDAFSVTWRLSDGRWFRVDAGVWNPTHWRPLPAPPEGKP